MSLQIRHIHYKLSVYVKQEKNQTFAGFYASSLQSYIDSANGGTIKGAVQNSPFYISQLIYPSTTTEGPEEPETAFTASLHAE